MQSTSTSVFRYADVYCDGICLLQGVFMLQTVNYPFKYGQFDIICAKNSEQEMSQFVYNKNMYLFK